MTQVNPENEISLSSSFYNNISFIRVFLDVFYKLVYNKKKLSFKKVLLPYYSLYFNLQNTNLLWFNEKKIELILQNGKELLNTVYGYMFDIAYLIHFVSGSYEPIKLLLDKFDFTYKDKEKKYTIIYYIDFNSHKNISKFLMQEGILTMNLTETNEVFSYVSDSLPNTVHNNDSFSFNLLFLIYYYFHDTDIEGLKANIKFLKEVILSDLIELKKISNTKVEDSKNNLKCFLSDVIYTEIGKKLKSGGYFKQMTKLEKKQLVEIFDEEVTKGFNISKNILEKRSFLTSAVGNLRRIRFYQLED